MRRKFPLKVIEAIRANRINYCEAEDYIRLVNAARTPFEKRRLAYLDRHINPEKYYSSKEK